MMQETNSSFLKLKTMKKIYLALMLSALTITQTAYGQSLSIEKTVIKTGTGYQSFNMVEDSTPNIVSETMIQIYFHLEVPDSATARVTGIAAHYSGGTSGTPFYSVVNDSATDGYTAYTMPLGKLNKYGDTIISTAFGADMPFTHEVIPWEIYWITARELITNSVVTYRAKNYLTVGPNPAVHVMTVSCPLWRGSTHIVYDLSGRKVLSINAEAETTTIACADLPTGIYILRTENKDLNMRIATKFVKQ
jgi:hypothetical protein